MSVTRSLTQCLRDTVNVSGCGRVADSDLSQFLSFSPSNLTRSLTSCHLLSADDSGFIQRASRSLGDCSVGRVYTTAVWTVVAVSGKRHISDGAGVFIRAALLSLSLSVPLKWTSTSGNPAAQCCCETTLHALFFQAAQARQPIKASITFTSKGFRSRYTSQGWANSNLRYHWLPFNRTLKKAEHAESEFCCCEPAICNYISLNDVSPPRSNKPLRAVFEYDREYP